jgi:hypothetical protein
MLPYSFSRAMLMEVSMAETSISTMVSTPGTKRKALFISGCSAGDAPRGSSSGIRFVGLAPPTSCDHLRRVGDEDVRHVGIRSIGDQCDLRAAFFQVLGEVGADPTTSFAFPSLKTLFDVLRTLERTGITK